MKNKAFKIHMMILSQKYLGLILCLISSLAFGQTNEEIRKRADDFFESEKYIEATKDYLHLLSLTPTDSDLNFKYGTCLLFNSTNKNKAFRYLSYAVKNDEIDPRAFFFNGKALHLDYQFEKAKQSYITYQEKRAKKDVRYNAELSIKMCESGKKLLSSFTDIIVTNKQEIGKDNFYKIYSDSKTIGGEILVVAKFQSKIDKKMNHIPVVHFPPNAKAIYYSSYGEDEANGLDIYIRRKLPDGSWGDPQPLPGAVNTSENEDFPYLHPSGNFLYFSSMGHNSMGGYDVFMSRLDTETNSFFTPENVDFAISSPDDDLFYVVDSLFQNAYFASSRQSEDGKYHVYNVKVTRVPIQEIIVMGNFLSEINPNNETMRINITSASNGSEVGKIVSNEQGNYSFVFPKGGKYNYEITVDGNPNNIYKYEVDLPFLDEFRPLKQKAIHQMVDGEEIVTIINLFDENVEGGEAMIAEVIRKKAVLDVNVDNFDLKELERAAERNKILAEIGFMNLSIVEVSERLNELAESEQKRSEMVVRIESNLDLAILSKSEELKKLNAELKELLAKVETATDPIEKHSFLMEASKIEAEIARINSEIAIINTMKNEVIQQVGAPSNSGLGKIEVIENQYNSLVSAGKEDDALALLIKNKDVLQKAKNQSAEKYVSKLVEKSIKLNEVIKTLKKQQVDLELNKNAVEAQINQLNSQLINAKKKEAEQIKAQILEKENELVMINDLLKNTNKRIIEKNTELDILNNSIEALKKAMTNTDLAAYNKPDVEIAIKKSRAIENELISKGINDQIEILEKNNPELRGDDNVTNELENSLVEIQNDYSDKIAEINANSNLNAEEKLKQAQKVINESKASTDRRINSIERELIENPDNSALINEKEGLAEYKNQLENEGTALANELNAINSVASNSANQLDVIKSSLEMEISEIDSNNSTTPKEKIELKQKAVQESISAIEIRLNNVNKELKADPNNKSLQGQRTDLTSYKSELESNRTELSNELAELNSASSSNDLVAIQNKLNENKEAILSNNSLSSEDKIKGQEQANNESLAEITKRLTDIYEQLKKSPNNASLKNEKEALTEYQTEIGEENNRLSAELLDLKNSTSKKNQLEAIQANLTEKIEAIKSNTSTTEAQKIKSQQEANNETIAQVDKRLNEIKSALAKDPNNAILKSESAQLEDYKITLQSDNLRLNLELIALNNGNTPLTSELENIQASLTKKIEDIKTNTSTSEEHKIKSQQEANNEGIAQVDKRINDIESQLSSEPDNTALLKEQLSLILYKTTLEQENTELAESLKALNPIDSNENLNTVSKEEVLSSVQADCQENANSINENSTLSEVDKLKQLQALDEKLIIALQKETVSNDKALSKRPDDKKLSDKKEVLADLIVQKQNEVDERTQIINAKNNISSVIDIESVKTELLTTINPNYTSEKEAIHSSNSTDFEKVEALLELENTQLTNLESKKAEIEKALKRNSSDEKLAAEKQAIEALFSEQKGNIEELKSTINSAITADIIATKINSIDKTYSSDISAIENQSTETKSEDLKARELELQEKIEATIAEKEKALSRSYSVTVDMEKAVFEKALAESKEREAGFENSVPTANGNKSFIAEVRATNNQQIESALNSNPTTKVDLEKADAILASYETELIQRIETIEKELQSSPTNELKEQKEWLENELESVQQKRRQFSVSRGELETEIIAGNSEEKIEKLKTELVDNQKEINENSDALLTAIKTSPENKALIMASEYSTEKQAEIESLRAVAEKEKSPQEKVKLLNEVSTAQKELNTTLNEVLAENKIKALENESGVSLLSEEELEKLKRKFSIEIGDLTTEIEKVEDQIKVASGNEKVQAENKKENLTREKSLLELRLEELMRNRPTQSTEVVSVIDKDAKNQAVSQADKTEIASSSNYEKYYNSATKAIELEKELTEKVDNLNNSKSELVKRIESGASLSSAEIKEKQAEIKAAETAVKATEKQFNQAKADANKQLPINSDEAAKMKALVAQGTEPDKTSTSVANNNTTNKNNTANNSNNNTSKNTDFTIHNKGSEVEKSMIPIGNENRSGLVYRVQVGAFSNPIPTTMYSEFDPVSGEVISGTNITRYMAGYFSTSNDAYNAQSKIRGFGYSDAFVVAYCNRERISIGEAKRRQSEGTCVANGETVFKSDGTIEQIDANGTSHTSTVGNNQNSSVNQAGNEVKTSNQTQQNGSTNANTESKVNNAPGSNNDHKPIETMEGLFFTVQIGVYIKYVDESELHGMKEVINLKLPDGQVRYSSGVFSSLDEAKPRRTLALNNGVRGAFITAYYKGERISIYEAKSLLATNGNSILQSEIEKNKKKEEVIVPLVEEEVIEVKKKNKVQYVSFNQYDSFPDEVINSYNLQGFYYYDSTDNHVKSILYKSEDDLPTNMDYKNQLEVITLELPSDDEQVIVVKVNSTVLPGDFMDWLMKQSFKREFTLYDDRIEIYLTGIELSDILKVQEECRTFVKEAELHNASDLENEN
jgi:epidermal growth factor receptor substrate 15